MISRRDWFQSALAAGMTLGSGLLGAEAARNGASPWKVGLGLNGFESAGPKYGKRYAIRDVLAFASRAGFDGVELVENWPEGPYPSALDKDRVRALRDLYQEFKLQIFSLQNGAADAFSPSLEARRNWLKQMRGRIELARALGCDCLGMWPYGGLREQSLNEAIAHLAASLREVAKIAHDQGITAAFEIEPPFVFHSEEHLSRILEKANEPKVKTIYDPSHFDLMNGSSGKPHEMLARIGVNHIGYVHFTDTDGTLRDGGTSKHLPAGEGHIDVEASFKTLREGGFRGWIMSDGYQVPDPFEAGAQCIQAVRRFARVR